MQGFFFETFDGSFIPHILKEIYMDRVYAPYLQGRKDLTIVDAGANVGMASFYFSRFAKRVIAVEPAAQHVACIKKLIEFNKLTNVVSYPYALSSCDGTSKFFHSDNRTMFTLDSVIHNDRLASIKSQVDDLWKDYEEVETRTLETLMRQMEIDTIDFMKMDIEGGEGDLIVSESFKSVAHKIGMILGEWHTWTSIDKDSFAAVFQSLGFKFNWLGSTEATCFAATR
jgi:FkbM family methyltransferase